MEEVPSAETYYKRGLEILKGRRVLLLFRDVDHPHAIELFQEVIDNYPYSEYATLAELKIADIQFEQSHFEEAASYYQDFVEQHPSHPQVPYALYRNGLSSFQQTGKSDQDQTATREAIAQFRVLQERFPGSKEAEEAEAHLQQSIDRLAEHELAVGSFYYRHGNYHAAARRFRRALTEYPRHTDRVRTMIRLARTLKEMNRFEEAEEIFQRVLAIRGEHPLDDDVEEELMDLGKELPKSWRDADGKLCVSYPDPSCSREIPEEPGEAR